MSKIVTDILAELRKHDGEQIGFVRDAIAEIERRDRAIDIAERQNAKLHDELEVATARIGNLEAQVRAVREPVAAFARLMERNLRANDHKGVDGWRRMSLLWLLKRLGQEYDELAKALESKDAERIESECADVANFAMGIADIVRERQRTA